MVLDYVGIQRDYDWLLRVLETSDIGTPFSNLEKLKSVLGVGVELGLDDTLATFARMIEAGLPVIVAVDSDQP